MSVHDFLGRDQLPTGSPRADRWIIRWRQGEENKSRTFRRDLGFTRADAVALDQATKRRKRNGGVDPLAGERDFEKVVEEWWASHHAELAPSTRNIVRSYVENRILPFFRGLRLCDIAPPEVEDWKGSLKATHTGEATQRKLIYTLSGIFAYAQRMGYRTDNPVAPIKKPGAYRQRLIQPFPPEMVERLRAWFIERGDIESVVFVSTLAYSGPRPEEAFAGLTWGDVGMSQIIYRANKTGRDRATRLLTPLGKDLFEWKRETGRDLGPVFGWSDSKYRNWRRRKFQVAASELGITTRPYDLRHAFVTLLAGEGKGTDYIARNLGHTVATCERWYRHLIEDADESRSADLRVIDAREAA